MGTPEISSGALRSSMGKRLGPNIPEQFSERWAKIQDALEMLPADLQEGVALTVKNMNKLPPD